MSELGIVEVHQGVADKEAALLALLERLGVGAHEAAVMGDDLPDIAVMKVAGLGLAPSDAAPATRRGPGRVSRPRGGPGGCPGGRARAPPPPGGRAPPPRAPPGCP